MKKYTKKQIKELKQNPYTLQVDEQRIFFTIEFKKVFWNKYQAGMSPRAIFKELDYNLENFGQKQIDSIVQRIKKEVSEGEFTEGYNRTKRIKINFITKNIGKYLEIFRNIWKKFKLNIDLIKIKW